jgi:hypothetical protein
VIERIVGINGHDSVGYCGTAPDGFQIWSDYSCSLKVTTYFDSNGNVTKVVFRGKVLGRSEYYAAPSTGITLSGGPGEVATYTTDYENGLMYFSGVGFKVNIPGQGVIFMQSGHFVMDLKTGLILSQSGHNDWMGANLEKLCTALSGE